MIMKKLNIYFVMSLLLGALSLGSCNDSKSYADLLNEESKAVNLFLADHRVVDGVPEDNKFEIGEDAPYYKLDEDGNVYMQVLRLGQPDEYREENPDYKEVMAEDGDRVYFRFIRYNLRYYVPGESMTGSGNAEDMSTTSMYFVYDDFQNNYSATYGEGIQMPLKYVPLDSKVNIIIKSQDGWSDEISNVVPFLYEITYYKSQI